MTKRVKKQTRVSPPGRRLEDTIAFPWQERDLMMLDHLLAQLGAKKDPARRFENDDDE